MYNVHTSKKFVQKTTNIQVRPKMHDSRIENHKNIPVIPQPDRPLLLGVFEEVDDENVVGGISMRCTSCNTISKCGETV